MKKVLLTLLLLGLASAAVVSDTQYSADSQITSNVTAGSFRRMQVKSIMALSSSATPVLTVYKADAKGTTTNYSVDFKVDMTQNTQLNLPTTVGTEPFFIGDTNTGYKFVITGASTSENSLVVTYEK